MNSIVIFVIWIGPFPNTYAYWVRTAVANDSISFTVFTDNDMESHDNITYVKTSLSEIRDRFQKLVRFPVVLDRPYKLCDFRPAVGEAFSDYTGGYDFWGYCDLDLFFGNIRDFVTPELTAQYDVIFTHGHLALYRNNARINRLYRCSPGMMGISFKQAFRSGAACYFDEHMGMNRILERASVNVYKHRGEIVDVIPGTVPFRAYNDVGEGYAMWKDGRLYWFDLERKEYVPKLYIHLQKRELRLPDEASENEGPVSFYITPDRITYALPENDPAGKTGCRPADPPAAPDWKQEIIQSKTPLRSLLPVLKKQSFLRFHT